MSSRWLKLNLEGEECLVKNCDYGHGIMKQMEKNVGKSVDLGILWLFYESPE